MSNRTQVHARNVHGQNPQFLVDKLVREKIYASVYWKAKCFALTAESVIDRADELKYIGGCYGANRKPTPFLCLLLKLLAIQPEPDIVKAFITVSDNKYLRALGAMYWRLVGGAVDVYSLLEPQYVDSAKLRLRTDSGVSSIFMDDFIDDLLTQPIVLSVTLPRLPRRDVLEVDGLLAPYVSPLAAELEAAEAEAAAAAATATSTGGGGRAGSRLHMRGGRERSRSRERERERSREADGGGPDRKAIEAAVATILRERPAMDPAQAREIAEANIERGRLGLKLLRY